MKSVTTFVLALLLGVALCAAPAYAQSFEIGAKIGILGGSDLDKAAPAGKKNDSNLFMYGLVGQYNIDQNWGVRLDIEMGTSEFVNSTTFVLSGVYSFTNMEANWLPFVRVGIAVMDADLDFAGAFDFDTEFGFELGVGVGYLYENWKFFGEVFYRSVTFGGDAITGDFEMNGLGFSLGFMYAF